MFVHAGLCMSSIYSALVLLGLLIVAFYEPDDDLGMNAQDGRDVARLSPLDTGR